MRKGDSEMAVPKAMQETYDKIAAIIVPFCREHMNEEYEELCLYTLEKLCRKRPSPLLSGKPNTWAAGIVYAIGSNNFIFDRSQEIHMSAEELSAPFGVSKSTAGSKGNQIRDMFKMSYFSPEWTLPSIRERHPLTFWFL